MTDRYLPREALRFIVAGGFNTVVTYALFWLLCAALHAQLAYAIAFAVGIVFAYLLNSRWVFGSRPGWRRAATYPLIYALTYVLNAGLLMVGTELLQLNPRLALAAALCVSTPVSFVLNRGLLGQAKKAKSRD